METVVRADFSSPRDAEAVLSLLNEYAIDPMGGGQGLAEFTRENLIDALRQRSNCHAVLVYVDDTPAALALCFEGFSTFACRALLNIHDFVVATRFRGRGLARVLLSEVERLAVELECCKLTLEVLEGNQHAQSVYRKFGFKGYELDPEMGRALFFEKVLTSSEA